MMRYDATSLADAAQWLRARVLSEVLDRPLPVLTEGDLDNFEAALLVELDALPHRPVEVGQGTDVRLIRAALAAGFALDYRWLDAVYVTLPT